MRWSDDLGAKKGDLERGHQSELERSGTIWNAIRAFNTPRASLRGMRLHWGPLWPLRPLGHEG